MCKGRHFTWFVLEVAGKRLRTLAAEQALVDLPGTKRMERGRYEGRRAIAATDILAPYPKAAGLRFRTCNSAKVVARADAGRWLLVTNRRGQLKLINQPKPGESPTKPFRPIVLVEVVDRL